jgi:hypothetical protein
MMDMEKLCEHLLAKMEANKEDLMATPDAKRKTDNDFLASWDADRRAR